MYDKSQEDQYNEMVRQQINDNIKSHTNNDAQLYEEEINIKMSRKEQFDQAFLNKFIHELEEIIHETEEFRFIGNPFRIAVSKFATDAEGQMLKNLSQDRKEAIYRDISRIFDKEPEGEAFKAKIRKIVNIRLEEVRRQIENDKEAEEYAKKLRENRLLTISKFDVQIIKDCEGFVGQMVALDEFDGSMMFAMKTILSYYEKKKDRILSDYLYMLSIPLVAAFGQNKHMHKIPVDLVGYFFTLTNIVKFFDPLVDLLVKHDEHYDAEMTDMFMNCLIVIDNDVCQKFADVLTLENPQSRTLLVLIVKRFVHSLGFAFLPLNITYYIWDQIFMKIVKNRLDIFVTMGCMLLCLKDSILLAQDWDQIVDIIYIEGQKIPFEYFVDQYKKIFVDSRYYLSQYNVNPEIVNRERGGELGERQNPLQQLLDEQSKRDQKTLRKKWKEGEHFDADADLDDEDGDDEIDPQYHQMQDIQIDDVMKDMKQEQQPYQNMGMVPIGQSRQNEDDSEEENSDDDFDPLQNM